MTTNKTEPKPDRKPVDRSPENDLREALDLVANARMKFIGKRDEAKGAKAKAIIDDINALIEST